MCGVVKKTFLFFFFFFYPSEVYMMGGKILYALRQRERE
jgi:hypothetical protein